MEPLSEQSDAVTRLYEILTRANLSVAFTKKVLVRPPFPFLHKVCTEALGRSGIFSHEQLTLGNLTTREQKAGFLVRALAFVAFTLRAIQADCVSILLFVSPVQVLAGFEVDRTHEFLRQLVLVHQLSDMDGIKASAAAEVQLKGENHLYTMAIKFRRGLTKAQAAVRLFLRNRAMTTTDGNNNDPTPPVPGTKFLKVFEGFGTFEGVVRSATDGVYVVYYAQDGDEEELDEQEMLEVLRQSRQLEAASSVVAPPQVESSADPSPPNTRTVEFVPVNLFGDLERELPSRQQQEVTRNTPSVSPSRNAAAATASKQLAALMQCDGLVSQGSPSQPGEVLLGDKSDLFRIALPKPATANASNNDGTSPQPNVGEPLWRKKLLALVHPNGVAAIPNPTTLYPPSTISK
ncbi:hypothetical protein H310_00358 [Aphanomyces invadans]|uniref:TRAF3-interacting protein 1 N-terminal domain-containing protein n=1 Tax=Aphanomyces invadans TaxID=157072 RepID=A0A024UVH0_9STRA|nr:hypothetical protein H310_00358 [Aphanomyces invadans]ETW09930.1 hypothetical protein H310_00358 [Aphanomyces invadans]|eukprot:XP_008861341.1 hypothetical protein H310_00358 [Aphanomyces invadans]